MSERRIVIVGSGAAGSLPSSPAPRHTCGNRVMVLERARASWPKSASRAADALQEALVVVRGIGHVSMRTHSKSMRCPTARPASASSWRRRRSERTCPCLLATPSAASLTAPWTTGRSSPACGLPRRTQRTRSVERLSADKRSGPVAPVLTEVPVCLAARGELGGASVGEDHAAAIIEKPVPSCLRGGDMVGTTTGNVIRGVTANHANHAKSWNG